MDGRAWGDELAERAFRETVSDMEAEAEAQNVPDNGPERPVDGLEKPPRVRGRSHLSSPQNGAERLRARLEALASERGQAARPASQGQGQTGPAVNPEALMVVVRALARHKAGPWWPQYAPAGRQRLLDGAQIPAAALLAELLPLLTRDDVPHLFNDDH